MQIVTWRGGFVAWCACSLGALALQASGCGSSGSTSDGGAEGGFDGGVDAVADAPAEALPHTGAILVFGSLDASLAAAGFFDTPPAPSCGQTVQTQGACTLTLGECDPGAIKSAYSAGTVTLHGTLASDMTLVPDGSAYPQVTGPRFWNGGETITASAAGATAPAFDVSVGAPSYVTVQQPSWPDAGGHVVVSRTSDLAVSWTGGSSGSVIVTLVTESTTADASLSASSLSCTFATSAGTGTVPASLIAQLPTAPFAAISVVTLATAQTTSGTWAIGIDLEAFASAPSGMTTYDTTLQLQ